MWQADDIIVISDIHLSVDRGRGLFQADDELVSFLRWIYQEARQSLFFMNGDVLDFLVSSEDESVSDVSDLTKAPARASKIIERHKEVFLALSLLAESPDHEVIVLAGNHDPEIALTEVQQTVEAAMRRMNASKGNLALKWLAHGLAAQLNVGAARIVIEHGDAFDAWNRIDHETFRRELMLVSRGIDSKNRRLPLRLLGLDIRYRQPPGSQLVGLLREIHQKIPWVELLKPESVLLPLIYANIDLNPRNDRRQTTRLLNLIKQFGRMKSRSILTEVRKTLNPKSVYRGATVVSDNRRFELWLQSVEQKQKRGLIRKWDIETQFERLVPYLRQAALEDRFFDIDAPDAANDDVAFLLKQGCDLVVNGHTHAAKAYAVSGTKGLYMNSGTWGRMMRLPPGESDERDWRDFISGLHAGRNSAFLRPTFVRVGLNRDTGETRALLCEWRNSAPAPLSEWSFAPTNRQWRKDE